MLQILNTIIDQYQDILANPQNALLIILNLILIESLLSVDNAAVLATMVMELPESQRSKALKYGIWGAYIFRGIALVFAAFLMQIWWLKPLGGAYLLWLTWDWWRGKQTIDKGDDLLDKRSNWFYKLTIGTFGTFWTTVIMVEIMDLAFSVENVFAAVAFTPNLLLVCMGVFIGILAMRFIANWFVSLMQKYPYLETSAFVVIGLLGLKLFASIFEHYLPDSNFTKIMHHHNTDIIISALTCLIFFIPIIGSELFKITHKKR